MAVQKVFRPVRDYGGTVTYATQDYTTSTATATINVGELLIHNIVQDPHAFPCWTGAPVVGSDEVLGLARKQGTETSSADGNVEVIGFIPGLTVTRGYATTSTNVNTATKLAALIGEWIYIDITALTSTNGHFTFDENEDNSEPNKGSFKIIDGDIIKYTVDCLIHANVTWAAPLTGQTMD